jgi:threonine aldolase
LIGEAAVLLNPELKTDFHTIMKQNGAVLAKSRLLGLQFEALFTDNLYEKICRHGIDMAMCLKEGFAAKGLAVVAESFTNQQFPILPENMYRSLLPMYAMGSWEVYSNGTRAVRFCTAGQPPKNRSRRLSVTSRLFNHNRQHPQRRFHTPLRFSIFAAIGAKPFPLCRQLPPNRATRNQPSEARRTGPPKTKAPRKQALRLLKD